MDIFMMYKDNFMKTTQYNPSPIEVEIAKALTDLQSELEAKLSNNKILGIDNEITKDNPLVRLHLQDSDGDAHEIVIKIIQKPDAP